jgi:hypothetical protein
MNRKKEAAKANAKQETTNINAFRREGVGRCSGVPLSEVPDPMMEIRWCANPLFQRKRMLGRSHLFSGLRQAVLCSVVFCAH